MLPSRRPTRADARTSSCPGTARIKKTAAPARGMSNEPCALAASLPSATAAAGSPSSGHLRPNRALICDLSCSIFSFLPVSPPPVVCARRSGTCRWRRSSWSGAPTASPPRDSRPHRRRGPLSATRLPSSPRSSPACGLPLPAVLVGAGCRSPRPSTGAHWRCGAPLPQSGRRLEELRAAVMVGQTGKVWHVVTL
jgi:hypothetical protein